MMACDSVMLTLPVPSRWDFGGYPYGLEPLTLPMRAPESTDTADGWDLPPAIDLESSLNQLLALGGSDDTALPTVPDPIDRIFWFRWITGHQTTFVLWQLLARTMAAVARGEVTAAAGEASSQIFVRGYSAMLLYTGSCPREVYHRVVRPSMALHHRAFSGSWARDFWPVRGLLGARALSNPPDTRLGRECALNRIIHEGIASKLVPDAPSLLQSAVGQRSSWRRATLAVLFDTYFLTLRAEVPYQAVVLQLMRRLHAIGRDLAANGLYPPFASSAGDKPPALRSPAVEECERTIPETLFALATEAAAGVGKGSAIR
jgi:hypothetical protein